MENGRLSHTYVAYTDLLPNRYTFMEELGEGSFGIVLKCLDTDTRDIVAVKLPKFNDASIREVIMMRRLMYKNMDHCNIVKFHDYFDMTLGPALVFEILDMSLTDYIFYNNSDPILLEDTRIITKQVAMALNALKSVGVIHADIKPDNVMLVNRTRPFKVKLIDFGVAILRSKARPGMTFQAVSFRSPEILLGLPFSEAIDMWGLGQLVFIMLIDTPLILAISEYQAIKFIVNLLGVPPDDLLNRGRKTNQFFTKTESNTWRLRTPEEYLGTIPDITFSRCILSSLDDMKTIYQKGNDEADAGKAEQCFELLEAMLTMDASQRITPLGVLSHPFITQDDQQDHQDYQDHQDDQDQKCTTDEGTVPSPTAPPSLVIHVRSAAAENTLQLEDEERADSLQDGPNETFEVSCHSSPPQSPAMTSEDSEEEEQKKKKKKKKKNICKRIWSWIKRTFCCNRVGVIGDEEGKK